jgi:hypothetical protein
MNLDEVQRRTVAAWIAEGAKLSEIQNRLASELGMKLTYMEVRLLVDDLKLMPKDPEPKTGIATVGTPATSEAAKTTPAPTDPLPVAGDQTGQLAVVVDKLARPGAIVSGQVTFSDGQKAEWYLDQGGRLGLAPEVKGYRPSAADVQDFQMALESELARMGFA